MRDRNFNNTEYRKAQNKQFLDKIFEIQRKQDLEKEEEEKERKRLEKKEAKKAIRQEKRNQRKILKAKKVVLSLAIGLSVFGAFVAFPVVSVFKSKADSTLKKFRESEEYQNILKNETSTFVEQYNRNEIGEIELLKELKALDTNDYAKEKLQNSEDEALKSTYEKQEKNFTASSISGTSAILASTTTFIAYGILDMKSKEFEESEKNAPSEEKEKEL